MAREKIRRPHKRIKYLRGKMRSGGITSVQVQSETGEWEDVTEKIQLESVIMNSMKKKYIASFHTPFVSRPLVHDFGYLGRGLYAQEVLEGTYQIPEELECITKEFMKHLQQPESITRAGEHPTTLPLETYREFWKKARERTSCYCGALSFSTLKATAMDDMMAEFECIMMKIPILTGYSPKR
jgi:hypothetical protein